MQQAQIRLVVVGLAFAVTAYFGGSLVMDRSPPPSTSPPISVSSQSAGSALIIGTNASGPVVVIQVPLPPEDPRTSAATVLAMSMAEADKTVVGSAAVSVPKSAKSGVPFTAHLQVSPDKLAPLLESIKADVKGGSQQMGKANVGLKPRMTATLSGLGFEIRPKDGYTQGVSLTGPTKWIWQVEAQRSGTLTLQFRLAGALNVEGKDVDREYFQYEQEVEVAVGWLGFFQQYWQWLVTTLALPALGGLWAIFRKPKDATGKTQPSIVDRIRARRRERAGR